MNLRLPGQYLDIETGLHDNGFRSYDPKAGRYLQPDPLGYPDGPDAYGYAGGDPVNRIDPSGLYQIDMHYYMTYFLGLDSGLTSDEEQLLAIYRSGRNRGMGDAILRVSRALAGD